MSPCRLTHRRHRILRTTRPALSTGSLLFLDHRPLENVVSFSWFFELTVDSFSFISTFAYLVMKIIRAPNFLLGKPHIFRYKLFLSSKFTSWNVMTFVSLVQKDFLYFLKILLKAARFLNGSLKFVLLFFQVLNGLGF